MSESERFAAFSTAEPSTPSPFEALREKMQRERGLTDEAYSELVPIPSPAILQAFSYGKRA